MRNTAATTPRFALAGQADVRARERRAALAKVVDAMELIGGIVATIGARAGNDAWIGTLD